MGKNVGEVLMVSYPFDWLFDEYGNRFISLTDVPDEEVEECRHDFDFHLRQSLPELQQCV